MPFTLSHAAAALPFRRFKPIWPALVIGTFAPDLQYFIWVSDEDRSGHHYPDVLMFTLPLALLVLWLFECIVKGPSHRILAQRMAAETSGQDRAPLSFRGWQRFRPIMFWIAVGTAHASRLGPIHATLYAVWRGFGRYSRPTSRCHSGIPYRWPGSSKT